MSAPKIQPNTIAPPVPANPEAERSILGVVVLKNETLLEVLPVLQREDFFLRSHQLIYSCMEELIGSGKPIDPISMMDALTRRGQLESAGGIAYLSQLADGLPKVTNVNHYVGIVKEKAAKRGLIEFGAWCQNAGLEEGISIEDLRSRAADVVEALCPNKERETATTLKIPDMPSVVLDGRLGEICQKRLGDLPLSYAWISLLTVAGTLVPVGGQPTNLYGAPIGPTGSGKSQAIKRSIKTMGLAKPQLENTLAGSFEGLASRLNVDGDARLLCPDELGHLLSKANIDGASFPFALNSAFYDQEFDLTAARGKQVSVNCRLSVIGGIVEENFSSLFGAATTAGLYDRFIFGYCPQPFQYHFRPFEGGPEYTEPCAVTIAHEVWEMRDVWLKEIPGLSTRVAELAIRAAVVAAAFSGRSILYAKHIEASSRAFAEYQLRMRQNFKPNPGENTDARCAFTILAALDAKPGWNLKRDIAKQIHYERFGPTAFERAINSLVAAGDININTKRPAKIRRVA